MLFCGLNKTTLLDYPGQVAATVFTGGCNFRCPYCQNGDLVLRPNKVPAITESELFSFLEKRRGKIKGVCITGGEPTIQPDLKEFIVRIRQLGFLVKLDTNGYNPQVLSELLSSGLLDYVAMDIKTSADEYNIICGLDHLNISNIKSSVSILKNAAIPYEFRTTIIKEYHSDSNILQIGEWLKGCHTYFLQSYQESPSVICPGFHSHSKKTLEHFITLLRPYIPTASIRGVD